MSDKCPKCGKRLRESRLRFGGEDCDFDDEQAVGPRMFICDCGVRFAIPKEAPDDA